MQNILEGIYNYTSVLINAYSMMKGHTITFLGLKSVVTETYAVGH